jgi:hypothetical protein
MALDSRQAKPENRAAHIHPTNLPMNARLIIAMVNAQVIPGKNRVNVSYQ